MAIAENSDKVRYLVFDIESVADPALVSMVRTGGEVEPKRALDDYVAELVEKRGKDFVPYTYHVPVSLALAKVRGDFSLEDITVLRVEDGGPRKICERFWGGWNYYERPQFVTFNGRGFDLPLMELTAFRYGVPVPDWFYDQGPSYNHPRNRYNRTFHLDLNAELTNYGASSFDGGLNLASKLIRKPGKMDVKGDMVLELFTAGRFDEIHSYCRCDVIDTYFVFLRWQRVKGAISAEREQELVEGVKSYMEEHMDEAPVYAEYVKAWERSESFQQDNNIFAQFENQN